MSVVVRFPDALARANRVVTNRVMSPVARRAPNFGIVEHLGRRSGTSYRTPVLLGGNRAHVLVPLMYGPDRDWVRNVLAAGELTVVHRGRRLRATSPRVVTDPAALPDAGWLWRTLTARVPIEGFLLADRLRT